MQAIRVELACSKGSLKLSRLERSPEQVSTPGKYDCCRMKRGEMSVWEDWLFLWGRIEFMCGWGECVCVGGGGEFVWGGESLYVCVEGVSVCGGG